MKIPWRAASLTPDHPAHQYFADRQQHALQPFAQLVPDREDRDVIARTCLALLDGLQIQWLRDPDLDLRAA